MGRICSLHDSILSQILSHLPTDAAIRTKVLSKQWENLWFPTQELVFCQMSKKETVLYIERIAKFINNNALLPIDTHSQITNCKIISRHESSFLGRFIELGVRAAILKRVKEVIIDLHVPESDYYPLPHLLQSYTSLERLTLRHDLSLSRPWNICWTSLKALTLEFTWINDACIKIILKGCLKVENLELNQCHGFNRIDAEFGSCLRRLVIIHCDQKSRGSFYKSMFISVPKVECLILKLSHILNLIDVSSLVDVTMDFYALAYDPNVTKGMKKDNVESDSLIRREISMEMLSKVGHAERVHLGAWGVKVVSSYVMREFPSPISLPNCKYLLLKTPVGRWDIPGILSLLQSSPLAETLVIHTFIHENNLQFSNSNKIGSLNANTYWKKQKNFPQNFLRQLKNVRIVGLFSTLLVGFAEFLLQNAKSLEKMELSKSYGNDDSLLNIQKILQLARFSPNAQIVIC